MGKLTREELLELKGSYYEGDKAIDTALSLMDENDALKAGIEKLEALVDEWMKMKIEGDSEAEYEQVIAITGCGEELKELLSDITGVGK